MTVARKKLIEVALPLEDINKAAAREKSIHRGHPSTLHPWWARRPLAAARAVIFAQMVDDPSANPDLFKTKKAQEKERQRLFGIIRELVQWENTNNEDVLQKGRAEIWQSWRRACADNADHPRAKELFDRNRLPAFHDPFAGGGSLPVEAQRLGLEAYASDLNPVAVLINKSLIEIPGKFAGRPPVNPKARAEETLTAWQWKGAQGLAEDVRYYGQWMRDEAEKRIGHLYPKIEITTEMAKSRPDLKPQVGKKLTVIAWLWARTVKSPNPAFRDVDVPLASTFMLSTKPGREAYVAPVIENGGYRFIVKVGKPKDPEATKLGTTAGKRSAFRCLLSNVPITYDYIRSEGKAGRIGERLMAIVGEGARGRIYLAPTDTDEGIARAARPEWKPDLTLPDNPRDFKTPNYGLKTFGDLFTPRQLVALTTFSDLVHEAMERAKHDAVVAGSVQDRRPLRDGGNGAVAYGEAVASYLGQTVSKISAYHCTMAVWRANMDKSGRAFGRQALPMVWDFAECNPFAGAGGDWAGACNDAANVVSMFSCTRPGHSYQYAAQLKGDHIGLNAVVSTDPPYYDNIGYADLSDFFYVWLRRALRSEFPELFSTVAVPKGEELVATPYRHGGKEAAESFFLAGMTEAMHRLTEQVHPSFPITIYYAFKQLETEGAQGVASTGWETFLDALTRAGFAVTGTWPVRTEQSAALKTSLNVLASSIVIVCRQKAALLTSITRRDFVNALKTELPSAVADLQKSNIAPVDLAQAAIGPGMAVFTRYAQVIDAEGKPLRVRDALALINQTLDEVLAEQEGDFDADTRWALAWFEHQGFAEGEYGVAETLSKAKNTSVGGMGSGDGKFVQSKRGKVRLLKPSELRDDWDPSSEKHVTVWECVNQLVRALESGGEPAAAELAAKLGSRAETARELAYRLYTIAERKKRAAEALSYNALVQSWPEIMRLARASAKPAEAAQAALL